MSRERASIANVDWKREACDTATGASGKARSPKLERRVNGVCNSLGVWLNLLGVATKTTLMSNFDGETKSFS